MAGFTDRPDAGLSIGVDNANAVCWAVKGARSKVDREIPSNFLLRCAKRGVEVVVVIFSLTTSHNIAADGVARLTDEELATRQSLKGLTRVSAHVQWCAFCQVAPHLVWDRIRAQRPPLELADDIITVLA